MTSALKNLTFQLLTLVILSRLSIFSCFYLVSPVCKTAAASPGIMSSYEFHKQEGNSSCILLLSLEGNARFLFDVSQTRTGSQDNSSLVTCKIRMKLFLYKFLSHTHLFQSVHCFSVLFHYLYFLICYNI